MPTTRIRKIAVIGLGTMGPGIMQSFAHAGFQVSGFDLAENARKQCQQVLTTIFKTLEEADLSTPEQSAHESARISFADSLAEAVQDADLVVEAVSENREVKRSVYEQIAEYAGENCFVWSNTSTMDIYKLLPVQLLEKSLIVHWFAPPHIIPLVEVVKGAESSAETVSLTLDLLKMMKKIPLVIERYLPGFVINRILRNLGREAFYLLDNNYVTAEGLDLAVKASIAPRMMLLGLIQRYDFTGLDLSARNLLDPEFYDPPIDNKPGSLYERIDRGELGVKSGKGFYDYSDLSAPVVSQARDKYLLQIFKNLEFCLKEERLV